MRSPADMGIIQIDITNACHSRCSNCTRLIGHHTKDQIFFMSIECFKEALNSLRGFPGIIGIIGGDPVLHPDFKEIITHLESVVKDPTKRGLWSSAPKKYFEHYELIQRVFPKWQFLNDRGPESGRLDVKSVPSIHQPMMVAIKDVIKDENLMWQLIDKCWVQETWSATITPKGAFVCEVMGSWDNLYNGPGGLKVEKGWWKIKPADPKFREQVERWCPGCGACLPTSRRKSSDIVDDISETHLSNLKSTSPKIKSNTFVKFDENNYSFESEESKWHPNAEWYLANGSADRLSEDNKEKFIKKSVETGLAVLSLRETAGLVNMIKQTESIDIENS